MNEPACCPECHNEMPPDAPGGLCPRCLLRVGLAEGSVPSQPADSRTAAYAPPPSVPTPAELRRHFPQLEIIELLGQGGMGAVYKARQTTLDRLVAVKVLPPRVGADPSFAERFTREARLLARLSHANIVNIYDFGQADGLYYFVMEYVDGVNLRQALQAGQFSLADALRVIPPICDALQFAHDEGVVHRDIKPENVLLDRRGRVKIADFGLAKLIGLSLDERALTGTRQVMGTLHYMAPEQMEGARAVDHRADIYSLGVLFYEMLTGELPLGRFPPPSRKANVDARLDEVVLRTLEKEPAERYQQASEVKSEVETILRTAPPNAVASEPAPPETDRQAAPVSTARVLALLLPPAAILVTTTIAIGLLLEFELDDLNWVSCSAAALLLVVGTVSAAVWAVTMLTRPSDPPDRRS